ncbi:DUF4153 domain-containing protein [Fusibacter ferrireducens]|uniref:DUF4153 domain-containing protein n=1 Tax=Fusibacter ferrireducens TaxID=2785058 RepID=A0ABR9ZRD3_9FIRM|nr:DUF4153 domain-containing protein [Fusibacter ferrireducens]MBF4692886.1 DUF4153 domain-containing protein [Fusibacter ferrireducens]
MMHLIRKLGKWLGYSGRTIKQSFERFPITLMATFAVVVIFVMIIHAMHPDDYQNVLMVFALAMPFSAILKLWHERTGKLKLGMQAILTVLLMISYYFVIPEPKSDVFWGQYFVLLILFYAVFFLVPYFPRREGFALALVERAGKFFLTTLYSIVLYLGLNAVLFSVEKLFELNLPSELPADLFFCVLGFFAVPYFLGSLPEIQHQEKPEGFSKIFKTLFLYILIPVQSIYTLILYAYFIRLLVIQTFPEGIIGDLVIWYALVSFLTLFSVKDLREDVPWLDNYTKIFSVTMVVPLGMFAIAMGIRIQHYGLTMARYLSIVAMIYLVIAYVTLPVRKRDVSVPLYIMAICMITVSFFGVLSWDRVVLKEQTNRLERYLIEAGYTLNETNWIAPTTVSEEQQELISDRLIYLTDHYEIGEITLLPEGFEIHQAEQYLGFEIKRSYPRYNTVNYFNQAFVNQNAPVDVKGQDYVMLLNRYEDRSYSLYDAHILLEKAGPSGKTASFEDDEYSSMKVTIEGLFVGEINVDDLAEKASVSNENTQIIEFKASDGEVLLLEFSFIEISGNKKTTGELAGIDYYQCWLKVSKK